MNKWPQKRRTGQNMENERETFCLSCISGRGEGPTQLVFPSFLHGEQRVHELKLRKVPGATYDEAMGSHGQVPVIQAA